MIRIPWQIKFVAKVALRALPLPYKFWQSLNIFKHGNMQNVDFAYKVVEEFSRVLENRNGKTLLELGPGDSLNTVLVARSLGFHNSILLDDGEFASLRVSDYRDSIRALTKKGLAPNPVRNFSSIDEMLRDYQGEYHTSGLVSLYNIPSNSVHLVISNAVLEHIELDQMPSLMRETFRILQPDGAAVHRIDFRDHINGDFKHLRFSKAFWEASIIKRTGCYVNRLHESDIVSAAIEAGFSTEITRIDGQRSGLDIKVHKDCHSWLGNKVILEGIDLVLKKN